MKNVKKRPNILIIVADQHRYDCLGSLNASDVNYVYQVKTPNLDRLASQGMKFTNAYTTLPACCPARQAMLRGRRPESFGALWNYGGSLMTGALKPDDYSWTKELHDNGYKTCHIGKWQENPQYGPEAFGYDINISDKEYSKFRKEKYGELKPEGGWMGGRDPVPVEGSRTHYLAARVTDVIKEYTGSGSPWHIRLNFSEPHLPCNPAGNFADMYKPEDFPMKKSFLDNFKDKPYIQKQQLRSWGIQDYSWDDWAKYAANYCGVVSQIDDAVGIILDVLKESGEADNTIVIYTSDHGDMGGSHKMIDKHYVMYDDIVRLPFIIRWPGVTEHGSVCNAFVSNGLDLAPTVLEAVGLPEKEEGFFHGRSIIPLLKGKVPDNWRSEIVCTYNGQQFGLYTQRMIRNNKWKYVWNTTDVDELYDLENDPDELVNRIYDESLSNVIKELRQKLYEILQKDGDQLVKNQWMKRQLVDGEKI